MAVDPKAELEADRALVEACARSMESGLEPPHARRLEHWAANAHRGIEALVSTLLERPTSAWADVVRGHRAGEHPWYDELADRVSVQEFAAFLLENRAFPEFLALLERVQEAQFCDTARAAVERNIAEEQGPVPHAELMRRMVTALAARAGDGLRLETFPSLVERTLAFYYGYYRDSWHLVGALFVTEALARHRVTRMGEGLRRLGLEATDLEFVRVHSQCDEVHAVDWSEGVIDPSVRVRPALRAAIARGVVLCLETSARYLDDLVARARSARAAA